MVYHNIVNLILERLDVGCLNAIVSDMGKIGVYKLNVVQVDIGHILLLKDV